MPQRFSPAHIPALFAASAMTLGGMWPLFKPRDAMLEFGFPERVANSPAAAPVMMVGTARTTVIGSLMLLFYSRGHLDLVDTVLACVGLWAGLVDSYVVWREGDTKKAIFRFISSGFLSAWGFAGFTSGWAVKA